ncbi:MAG: hypothetical protein P4L73_13425 [Caulobacteraceae bacterium]|nr:hypothetical protein [Caulobacteraceae bacterium]
MARVRFLADFDWWPTTTSVTAHKAGQELTVRRACADQAIAEGKAVEIDPPPRAPEDAAPQEPATDG